MNQNNGEIILYQPDSCIRLEVRIQEETVWLNRTQLAILFDRDIKTIGKHINNALQEELSDRSVVANFATTARVGFFVRTALPPVEGIFYDGQIFDAYTFVADLVRSAQTQVVLIDNYVDDTVLKILTKRGDGVRATIITRRISETFSLDLERHNLQYPPVNINTSGRFHDRFLIIDNTVYHLGASVKDLGKKLFAFNKMEVTAEEILRVTDHGIDANDSEACA